MIYKKIEESEHILKQIYACIDENDGIAKKEQLVEKGIDYRRVLDFVENGDIIRIKNGYYTYEMERFSADALVSKLFPDAVLCMESALYAYGYISTKPEEFHIAVDKNTSKSRFKLDYPKVIPYYTEPEVLKMGETEIEFENCKFHIYDKERLICDCLKYDNKLERKIFKEAILSYIQDDEKNVETLMLYAKERKVLKKVENIILLWLDDAPIKKEEIKEGKKAEKETEEKELETTEEKLKILIDEDNKEKNNTLVEDIFSIMKNLETTLYLSCFDRINEQLKSKVISGLYTFQELKDLKETEENIVSLERLNQFSEYRNHEDIKNKWQLYIEKHSKDVEEWEKVMDRLLAFIRPIWESVCKDEVFFEDWMPELERFLG